MFISVIYIYLPFGIIDGLVIQEQLVYKCVSISTFAPNTLMCTCSCTIGKRKYHSV